MKLTTFFLISFLAINNCANKLQETFPVSITEAYYQRWVAGVRGGGSGTGFYIKFEKVLPKDLVLNKLYFRGQKDSLRMIDETNYSASFIGKANWQKGNQEIVTDDSPKITNVAMPFELKDNEALIEYTQNKVKKYFKISNLKEKEMEMYPSVRPRN